MTAKRKRKRGRKPVENVDREPNGRRRREPKRREDMTAVAVNARMRHYGLGIDAARHEHCGTVQGRLWLSYEASGGKRGIPYSSREAADRAMQYHASMMRAIQAPDSLVAAGHGRGENITEDYIEWATRAVANFEALVRSPLVREQAYTIFEECILPPQRDPAPVELETLSRGLRAISIAMGVDEPDEIN